MTIIHVLPLTTIVLAKDTRIGLHIRKRRLELRLLQKDVGKMLGVTYESIMHWETNFSQPQIQLMPKIIAFLGYNPLKIEEVTLSEKLQNYLFENGMSHEKVAKLLQVDASTVGAWLEDTTKIRVKNLKRLHALLNEKTTRGV